MHDNIEINLGGIKRFPSFGLLPTPEVFWDFAWDSAWSRYNNILITMIVLSTNIHSISLQVFEVLHYLGSCVLKLIKAKVVSSGKKQRRVTSTSSSSRYETGARDEDPFLASIKRTNTTNTVRIQDNAAGEEYEPCISDKSASRGVPEGEESVESSNVQLDDKSSDTFKRKLSIHHVNGHAKDVKSFQVKYTDSKQPNR